MVSAGSNVLILGAGPAGSTCAIELCKAGLNVSIIDIVKFPRFRPGESCHPGVEPLLTQLGVWNNVVESCPIRHSSVWINVNGLLKEEAYGGDPEWKGIQLPRDVFDSILLNKAIACGAKFFENAKTTSLIFDGNRITGVQTTKGMFAADFVVDATGSKSISLLKMGMVKEKYSRNITCHYRKIVVSANQPPKLNAYFEITDRFWAYVSLIQGKTYSITFSSFGSCADTVESFIQSHIIENPVTLVRRGYETGWGIAPMHGIENLYIVGDAFMTFDPTSSKGILKSIMTGIYAAFIISKVNTWEISNSDGSLYHQRWGHEFFKTEITRIKQALPPSYINSIFK